ncbi:hypothetical protein GPECTOR_84g330 [Gonium pectorale]|uniref:Uncharacterized protein n=1 Tax=Gonium pectorale TaxID=33097 RepID=A0A150G1F5_GONPE|nr:hypothetical protein GPECTOR_84g330 [Gonium pectorale]|eukprot:KXZ43654.1 hypothetical protein GPECTOR_84g330 [Gonium pectorale]
MPHVGAVTAHLDGYADAEDRQDLRYEFEAWQDYPGAGSSHIFVSGDSPSAYMVGLQPDALVDVVACAVDARGARACGSGSITLDDDDTAAGPFINGNLSAVHDALLAIDLRAVVQAGAGAQLLLLQSSQAALLSRALAAASSSGGAGNGNRTLLGSHIASMVDILADELHKYDDMGMPDGNGFEQRQLISTAAGGGRRCRKKAIIKRRQALCPSGGHHQ